jgi:hypothetical protein
VRTGRGPVILTHVTPAEFAAKWKGVDRPERSAAQ